MQAILLTILVVAYASAVKLGCIEGIMGSGKTTLLSQIPPKIRIDDKLITIYKVEEPYPQLKESKLLEVYSSNYATLNIPIQLAIHSGLLAQFIHVQHTQRHHDFIIFDRCPETALDVYIHTAGPISEAETQMIGAYKEFIYTYLSTWKDFDFRIYLNISAETAYSRIQTRNRSNAENSIPVVYLQTLLGLFEKWAENSHILYQNTLESFTSVIKNFIE